jgi:hypothetical protein
MTTTLLASLKSAPLPLPLVLKGLPQFMSATHLLRPYQNLGTQPFFGLVDQPQFASIARLLRSHQDPETTHLRLRYRQAQVVTVDQPQFVSTAYLLRSWQGPRTAQPLRRHLPLRISREFYRNWPPCSSQHFSTGNRLPASRRPWKRERQLPPAPKLQAVDELQPQTHLYSPLKSEETVPRQPASGLSLKIPLRDLTKTGNSTRKSCDACETSTSVN